MSDKKDKIDLKDFCQIGLQYVLQPQELDLSVINPDKLITDEETKKIEDRLLLFKTTAFCDMMYQYCMHNELPYDDAKIYENQGYAIASSLHTQCGYTAEKITAFFSNLREYGQGSYTFYDDLVKQTKDENITFSLSMCKEFSDYFEKDNTSENNRKRKYILFDLAQQIYIQTTELFETILKQYELV